MLYVNFLIIVSCFLKIDKPFDQNIIFSVMNINEYFYLIRIIVPGGDETKRGALHLPVDTGE